MSYSSQPERRFFPRNLTARSDLVRGNPVNSRPESGVDNAHPGIEFDQRVFNRVFFPGLVFDFQYGVGARLVEIHPTLFKPPNNLTPKDLNGAMLFLWYIIVPGEPGNPSTRSLIELYGQDGYEVLRTVTNLDPGPLIVVVGRPPEQLVLPMEALMQVLAKFVPGPSETEELETQILRDADGSVQIALLVGHRANYLDDNGVINTDLIEPGQLTESLCSPWQWDFAECGCFYWAGSKPDIVIGQDGTAQALNFQRDRARVSEQPSLPPRDPKSWMQLQLTPQQMIRQWETLPFVVGERETNVFTPGEWPKATHIFDRARVVEELGYLATVEHAVLVQYLYACYSINSPAMDRNAMTPRAFAFAQDTVGQLGADDRRVFAAANEILMIAIEEMRHFRWVNEARRLLDHPPALGRAVFIGHGGRTIYVPYALRPLTREQLDQFIHIEAPSNAYREDPRSLEGLYTHILVSIHSWKDEDCAEAQRVRLLELIKLIIDEGADHYRRFLLVKEHLSGIEEDHLLRIKTEPKIASDPGQRRLQNLADAYYDTLLRTLQFVCSAEDPGGRLLEQARRLMFNLHEVAVSLSAQGATVLFTLPKWLRGKGGTGGGGANPLTPPGTTAAGAAERSFSRIDALRKPTRRPLDDLARSESPAMRQMAQRHKADIERLVQGLTRALRREEEG